ncbi:RNA-directed DNA polymerase, eukaryota, reverse transcriptase zinc-binding domain protein [Tanacetum coccineum]
MWYYFNEQWEKMVRKNKKGNGTKNQMKNDVLEDDNNIVQNMTAKDFKSSYNDVLKNDHLGVESIISNHKFFVSIIYALNNRRERKILWNDLKNQSNSINNKPWALMGDFNVTLRVDEHSAGGAFASADMQQFQAYMNDIEVMDLRRTVFHFTWTKSLNNPNSHILKKLDRIMGNDLFVELFKDAYACFCHTSFLVTVLIKGVLGKVVDLNQSAFIPGRNITDNILLTQELLKGYSWKNGVHTDSQTKINASREFKYHTGCKELKITHLCFANDLLVLCNGDVHYVVVIKEALDLFSQSSRLHANMKKSTMFCGSMKEGVKRDILKIMPFK